MKFVRMLSALASEADNMLGDLVRGDWYCPTAVGYGRYVPCGGENCFFCSGHRKFVSVFWV